MALNVKAMVAAAAVSLGTLGMVAAPIDSASAAFHGGGHFGGGHFGGGHFGGGHFGGGHFGGGHFGGPRFGGYRGYRGYGYGYGGFPLAAGLFGGLALGAIAANSYGYYGYGYGCYLANQPVYTPYGAFAGYQRVRVCR